MDRVKVASILEELILQTQDREALIDRAAMILKDLDDEDNEASEWIDSYFSHAFRRTEFDEMISKLVRALKEGDEI